MSDLSEKRREMDAALKRDVVPLLRAKGFKGAYPYFRRHCSSAIDLLSFQFDKYGGGFFIEIARSPPQGLVTFFGRVIPPGKVRSWDVHPDGRKRIMATPGDASTDWYRFDANPIEQLVALVIERLSADDLWNDLGPPVLWR